MQEMNQTDVQYAMVTGGSEGIGKAIATELASRGYGLLIVALPDKNLGTVAVALSRQYQVPVHTLGVDLTRDDVDLEIYQWVTRNHYKLTILVNNAGFGSLGPFMGYDRDFYQRMMHINMVNVVNLSRLMMDILLSADKAHILYVGSIASFYPIPYKVVYASTKYFLYSFSRALREEFRGSHVKVCLLCPGPVYTNSEIKKRITATGILGRMTSLNPSYVGRIAVKRMLRGKWLVLPGLTAKICFMGEKIIPTTMKQWIIAMQFRKGCG